MKLRDFLKDQAMFFLWNIVGMGVLTVFLRLTGYHRANIILILIFWFLSAGVRLLALYLSRKKYFDETDRILENLDQRYLLGELLPDSFRLEDRLYREMICRSNKSVIERIRRMEDAQRDYKEYIEGWVHEIKAPITAVTLLCENGRKSGLSDAQKELLRTVGMENQKIENYVDMALYYARSEQVYKDFLIKETNLQKVVWEVLEKNRLLLIQNRVRIEVECADLVYTDGKWIAFILNQMILNSVKYCGPSPVFRIYSKSGKDGVVLTVEDNGAGILPEDLPRIFEKGFTGSNGRNHKGATGMGLYLCKKLCDQLEVGLSVESEAGKGTKMLLTFPVSTYVNKSYLSKM